MRTTRLLWTLAVTALLAGCSADSAIDDDARTTTEPIIHELAVDRLTIGEPLLLRGSNLVEEDGDGLVRLRFTGEFRGDDGSVTPTDFVVTTTFDSQLEDGDHVVRWSRFGPYENPFADINVPGAFEGTIVATSIRSDGTEITGPESDPTTLRIDPSIEIETLQPVVADCGQPAIRGLGGLPYEMTVRAVGFTPVTWRYELGEINGDAGVTTFERPAVGPTDTIGWDEPVIANPVGDDQQFYATTWRVIATDAQGRMAEAALPWTIHRPLEVRYDGNYQVAQYFEPKPVTGCIPGQPGNRVTYSETQSETRQQSVTVTVSNNWNRSNGVTNTAGWTEGYSSGTTQSSTSSTSLTEQESVSQGETYGVSHNSSSSNSIGFSSTDGESWSYDVTSGSTRSEGVNRMNELSANAEVSASVTAGGEVGVPLVANGKAEATVGTSVGVGAAHRWGSDERYGTSHSEGYSSSGSTSTNRSYGSVTTEGSTSSVGGSYVLSGSTSQSRGLSDTESRNETRTYNMNQGVAQSEVVSEGMTEAEARTWVESTTSTTLTSYSGFIPVGRFGVFYRQTVRLVRRADVFTYNLCGVAEKQSEMYFNEWTWAPDLASGPDCGATLPPSNLPQAECFIQPCWQ